MGLVVGIIFIAILVIAAFSSGFKDKDGGEFAKGCGLFVLLIVLVIFALAIWLFSSMA
jgi:hypothetical protein